MRMIFFDFEIFAILQPFMCLKSTVNVSDQLIDIVVLVIFWMILMIFAMKSITFFKSQFL